MRLIAIALLAGTSLALAACGGGAEDSAEPTDAATDAVAAASPAATESASPSPSPSASASPTPTPSASAKPAGGMAAAAATAPTTFNQCKACHSVERGKHGIGPSLAGVFGDKAGDVPGFEFSDAMKGSGLTWNAATLDRYLENPRGVVPGTTMAFAGIKDAAKRKEVVDYIKTL
jgi:cytochrome c